MNIKNNDWFAVLTNIDNNDSVNLGENPFTMLYVNGITPDNTDLKSEDYYKNIPQVQNKFTKADGTFDEALFNQFYQSAQRSYNEFAEIDFAGKILDLIGTTPYDSNLVEHPERRVNHFEAVIVPFHDKNRSTYGTGNLWETGSPTFSDREVAQANFVRDENGNVLDWTPNDKAGLFKSLFTTPALAYASYDEDVFDENGRLIHQKGELKLDENGDPYTEILGNREAYGKEMVKWTDTFSVEGTFANKIDIFDSDSIDKSIGKVVAQTAVMLLPYFTPIAPYWGYLNATLAMSKAMPTIVKSLNGLLGSNKEINESVTWFENVMGRFGTSRSDSAKGKFFSAENIGDIIVSSAGQLFSQKQIANLVGKWKPFSDAERNRKLAQTLSLGYMSITSATDSYGSFKEAGAEDWLAGIGSILTMGAYYVLLNLGYFKDKLFEGTWLDEDQRVIQNISELSKYVFVKNFGDLKNVTKDEVKKALPRIWNSIKNGIKSLPKGVAYEGRPLVSRAINEGLEETIEEVAQDAIKGLAKGLEFIGVDCTDGVENLDFGWTVGSAMERYASSFAGGMIGGMVFEINNQWNLYKDPNYRKLLNSTPIRRMYYDIMRGHADKYRDIIRKEGSKGLNGNTNLTASYKTVKDSEGRYNKVYSAGTDSDNQNLAITNELLRLVDNAEFICNNNNLIFSNLELLEKILGSDTVKQYLEDFKSSRDDFIIGVLKGDQSDAEAVVNALLDLTIKDSGGKDVRIGEAIAENVLVDVNNIRQEIFDLEVKIETELAKLPPGTIQNDEDRKRIIRSNSKLKEWEDKKKELAKQFQEIISGKHADNFLTQILMFFDDSLLNTYMGLGHDVELEARSTKNIENFAKLRHGITDWSSIDDGRKEVIEQEYEDFIIERQNWYRRAADLHIKLSESTADVLQAIDEELEGATLSENYLFNSQKITIQDFLETMEDADRQATNIIAQFAAMGITDPNDDPKLKNAIETKHRISITRSYFENVPGEAKFGEWFNALSMEMGDSDRAILARQDVVRTFYQDVLDKKAVGISDNHLRMLFSMWNLGASTRLDAWEETIVFAFFNINKLAKDLKVSPEQVLEMTKGIFPDSFPDEIVDNIQSAIQTEQDRAKEQFEILKNKIQRIESIFKQDPRTAVEEVENLIAELSKTDEDGNPIFNIEVIKNGRLAEDINSIEDFVHRIFDPSKSNDPIDYAKEILGMIDRAEPSPLMKLMQDISVKLTGEPSRIFALIEEERANVKYASINKWSLSKKSEKEMRDAEGILNIVSALIEASIPGNLNELVNTRRELPFAIISPNTAQILKTELEFVKRQLAAFKRVSDTNKGNRIAENKNLAKYDSVKRFMRLMLPPGDDTLIGRIQKALGINFSDFASKSNYSLDNIAQWSDSDFDAFYIVESAFKNELYKWFQSKSEEEQKIIFTKIGQIVASVKSTTEEFSADPESEIGDWGTIRYLLSNLATSFGEFQGLYKSATDNLDGFLPFYGQEFVVRDAYSAFEKSDLYNAFLNGMYSEVLKKITDTKGKEFVKKMAVLKNFFFINGIPGSGKSTACAKILIEVLKTKYSDLEVIALVQDDTRLNVEDPDSFGNVLGVPNDHCFVTSDFIENNVYAGIQVAKKDTTTNHSTIELKAENFKTKDFKVGPTTKRVLFVLDEATFANEKQLEAFSKFIEQLTTRGLKANIVGLGDFYQSGAESDYTGITDTFFQASVRLTSGFRLANNGKSENERNARGILKNAIEKYHENIVIEEETLDKIVYEGLDVFNSKPLIGFVDSEGRIFGDVHRNKADIPGIIEKLKSLYEEEDLTPSICIITNNPSDYEKFVESGIDVRTPKGAQGGQWDYVISDVSFAFAENEAFSEFKKFYTIMTRARRGTVWIGSIGSIKFNETEDASRIVGKDMNSEEIRKEYVNWRKHLFELIPLETVSRETDNGSSILDEELPLPEVVDDTAEEIKALYIPATESEIEDFRRRLYEQDTTDPEIIEFRKTHSVHIGNYRERQKSLEGNDPSGLDFDSWFNWTKNEDNLRETCPIENVDIDEYRKYVMYLGEVIAECLSESGNVADKLSRFGAKYGETGVFVQLTKLLRDNIKNAKGYLQIRQIGNIGEQKLNIVYYVLTDAGGKDIAIPIWANRQEMTNCSFKLKDVTTKVVAKPIPISSNGAKFTEFSSISEKVQLLDRIMIFKGVPEDTKMTASQREFNKRNKGKAFILISTLTDRSSYDEWDSFFNIKYNDDGEVTSFIDENGHLYVSLVGIQKRCTTNDFLSIVELIQDAIVAAHEGDEDLYRESVIKIKELIHTDSFSVKGPPVRGRVNPYYDDSAQVNENHIFSPHVTTYLLNYIFRNFKSQIPGINTHLQSSKKMIRFGSAGTYLSIYTDDSGKLRFTTGDAPLESDSEINLNLIDNDALGIDYLVNLFTEALIEIKNINSETYNKLISSFGLSDSSDKVQVQNEIRELLNKNNQNGAYAFNFYFGGLSRNLDSFYTDNIGNWLYQWKTDEIDMQSFLKDNASLFKHNLINLQIHADGFKDNDTLVAWGWVLEQDMTGFGSDLVDILPTSYEMKIDGDKGDPIIKFNNEVNNEGTISIDNFYADMNMELVPLEANNIIVDRNWLLNNITETSIPEGKSFRIKSINTKTGEIRVSGFTFTLTLKPDTLLWFNSKFKKPSVKFGKVEVIGTKILYDGKVVEKVFGFAKKQTPFVYLLVEGNVVKTQIDETVLEALEGQASFKNEEIVKVDSNEIITVNDSGYRLYKRSDGSVVQVNDFVIGDGSAHGIPLEELEYWNKRYKLDTQYESFVNKLTKDLLETWNAPNSHAERVIKDTIKIILLKSNDLNAALNEINEELDKYKYQLGIKLSYDANGMRVQDQTNARNYFYGYLVSEWLSENKSEEVVENVEIIGNSPRFSVTLSSGEKLSFLFDDSSRTISEIQNNPNISDDKLVTLCDTLINDPEAKIILHGFGVTTSEELQEKDIEFWNDLYDALENTNMEITVGKIVDLIKDC